MIQNCDSHGWRIRFCYQDLSSLCHQLQG
ncbi:phosphorylase, Pnp/Udp family [Streptococcus pneumoniae]|nr:phosphorylase, Pnp/Udp family [Streptococcus pneumoniae]